VEGAVSGAPAPPRPIRLVALRCRTSERSEAAVRGVEPLAAAIGDACSESPRLIGSPGEPAAKDFADDLASSRGCLLEAGGQVDDALVAGELPVLVAGECSIAVSTLPVVARHRPDAVVLWLDAHGDFNTPSTTESGYLGGMALAGGCGRWETGFDGAFDPRRAVLCGVRALDNGEREELQRAQATVIGPTLETLVYLQNALDRRPVYIHLDLDVLDPSVFPAQFPEDGGFSEEKLYDLLEAVADSCELVGLEIAGFAAPEVAGERVRFAQVAAAALTPVLLEAASQAE
jgi:arginase family enzyme